MFDVALLSLCLSGEADPMLVRAIIEHESDGNPIALNINRWPESMPKLTEREETIALARNAIDAGYTVDVGLMQINSNNLRRFGFTLEQALDPCTNIKLGERVLKDSISAAFGSGYRNEAATLVALSYYNTGTASIGFDNGYVGAVWKHYLGYLEREVYAASTSVAWPGTKLPDWNTSDE